MSRDAHLVCVVQVQDPAPGLIHLLVTLIRASHVEGGIHVDVVAGQVQRDKPLEDDGPARPRGREEDEEARGRAAIGHHVQHRAKLGGLFEVSGGIPVQRVEEAGDAIQGRTGPRMQWHVV